MKKEGENEAIENDYKLRICSTSSRKLSNLLARAHKTSQNQGRHLKSLVHFLLHSQKSCEYLDGTEEALEATRTTSCPENCHP